MKRTLISLLLAVICFISAFNASAAWAQTQESVVSRVLRTFDLQSLKNEVMNSILESVAFCSEKAKNLLV